MSLIEKIKEAKEIIGDEAALTIAKHYNIEKFDEVHLKGCCPFHKENTPSFIWNRKDKAFKCFGCSRRLSILDMYVETEGSYRSAVAKLLGETGISFTSSDLIKKVDEHSDIFKNYKFPKEEEKIKGKALAYCQKRGISKSVLEYMDIKSDEHDNIVFELKDMENRHVASKYRPSRKIKKSEPKMWWQQNSSMCPVLYNMEKIDITQPLVVVEGYFDCLSVIEAGYTNVVSIPSGANDMQWIEFNYDFLSNFEEIILWFDNDTAGQDGLKKAVNRLGEYRCKIVKPTEENEDFVEKYYQQFSSKSSIRKTDANNILLAQGELAIIALISGAEYVPVKNLVYLMDSEPTNILDLEKMSTGIKSMDDVLYGNVFPCFTIYSGVAGCVDKDTEYFNGKRWVKISNYKEGDKVLTYNLSGKATLEPPLEYHNHSAKELWLADDGAFFSQCLSKKHKVLYRDEDGTLRTTRALNVIRENKYDGFKGSILSTFKWDGAGIDLDKLDLLYHILLYSIGLSNNRGIIKYSLKGISENKRNYIYDILNGQNKGYTIENEILEFDYSVGKTDIAEDWYNVSQDQISTIVDFLRKWGDSEDLDIPFYTSTKTCADFLQFCLSASGFHSTVSRNEILVKDINDNFCVVAYPFDSFNLKYADGDVVPFKKIVPDDGKEYCFTTNTGFWVMRRNGRISVTGNSGKSSLANISAVLSAIENNKKVFIFSGELERGQLLDWLISPLAGENNMARFISKEYNRPFYVPTTQAKKIIKEYYHNNIISFDATQTLDTSGEAILEAMTNAYKRYGCTVFLIDNLMCIDFSGFGSENKWDSQKRFITHLMNFTLQYQVSTNMILHPKKPAAGVVQNSVYDLHGASEIGNLCHRLFWVRKDTSQAEKDTDINSLMIEIIKDRPSQMADKKCAGFYDKRTRRIFSTKEELYKKYRWENSTAINYPPAITDSLLCNLPPVDLSIMNPEQPF